MPHPLQHLISDRYGEDNRQEPLKRLHAVRDIFNSRSQQLVEGLEQKRISLAEGGCLMPPHVSVLKVLQETAFDLHDFPYQIYPQENVNSQFIAEIEKYFGDHCGIRIKDDTGIAIGFGSSHIFDGVLSAICDPGDTVIAPTSFYHSFADWPTKWGAHMEMVETSADNGFKLTAGNLSAWLQNPANAAKTVKCLILTNPTTTGALYTRDELSALGEVVKAHGLMVYCDEVFRDSEFGEQKTVSMASIPGLEDYTITSTSGSKTRSVADFRLGWACGPQVVMDRVISYMERTITDIPLYLQKLGIAVLQTPDTYLDIARGEYKERADLISRLVEKANSTLNEQFGTNEDYIRIPCEAQAGHYVALDLSRLTGATTPAGSVIRNGEDLTRYLAFGNRHNPGEGVVFSSGFSKGHDDLIVYAAFAQLGFEAVNDAFKPRVAQALRESFERRNGGPAAAVDTSMALTDAEKDSFLIGRAILEEAFARVTNLIGSLELPGLKNDAKLDIASSSKRQAPAKLGL